MNNYEDNCVLNENWEMLSQITKNFINGENNKRKFKILIIGSKEQYESLLSEFPTNLENELEKVSIKWISVI